MSRFYDGLVGSEVLAPHPLMIERDVTPSPMAQSIDDVPSCGQENDYRRAQSNGDAQWAVDAQLRCNACGILNSFEPNDELTTIRTQLEAARKALEPFAEIARELSLQLDDNDKNDMRWAVPTAGAFRAALAALEGSRS